MSLVPHPTGSFEHSDDPGEPTTGVPRLSVTQLEGEVLAALVVGRRVLEIGTGLGVSTRAMAATAAEIVTLDVDEWVHEAIWPDLPDNVTGVRSVDELDGEFDAVFIDADHSAQAVAKDLRTALTVCHRGVVIAHDTGSEMVRDGLAAVDGWAFICTTHGLGVLWR